MEITRKLSDLQQYASNIADGSVSMSDMMNTPCSMFGRQLMYMQYAHNGAMLGAQQKMAMMQPMMTTQMQQMPNAAYQQMYQQWIFKNLYNQERERIGKQETKLLNEQEKQIQAEKQKIETQLKLLDQEYDSCKQAESKEAERWKPEYV
jgi:predicted glutamine amidotransferase